jgi:nucleotide-binding universal stress UspA family protein
MQKPFSRVLVPVDLSPVSDRLLRCTSRLPIADDATVTLLHVVSDDLAPADRRVALKDTAVALEEMAAQLTAKREGFTVRSVRLAGTPATEIARFARASKAELAIMGCCRSKSGSSFLGSTAERVVRRGQLPVLIARRGVGNYQRPALAIDGEPEARAAIRILLRTLAEPRPPVRVIHAIESPYRGMYYRSLTASEAALHERQYAAEESERIDELIASALRQAGASPSAADNWKYVLPAGPARTIVPRETNRMKADLLVLGTRGRSGISFAYLGSVAGDLLRNVECDVLVVPRIA